MLRNETHTNGAPAPEPCDSCGCTEFPLQVLRTCAHYVGTACKGCGMPESRETGYFGSREEAEAALGRMKKADLSDTRAAKQVGGLGAPRGDA